MSPGLQIESDGIDRLHGLLISRLQEHVNGEIRIDCPNYTDSRWKQPNVAGAVDFSLTSFIPQWFPGTPRVPVVELKASLDGASAWVSWRDVWVKQGHGRDKFTFSNASVGFFFGSSLAAEERICRAEWELDASRTARAAHPHWHFDLPSDLGYSLKRFHFPMAGWKFSGACPQCWDASIDDPDDILDWSARIVDYVRHQISHFPPTAD